jgi:hypothetical protein
MLISLNVGKQLQFQIVLELEGRKQPLSFLFYDGTHFTFTTLTQIFCLWISTFVLLEGKTNALTILCS